MLPFKIKCPQLNETQHSDVGVNVYFYTFIERKYITLESSVDQITAQCSPDDESNTLQKITNSAFILYKSSTFHQDICEWNYQPARLYFSHNSDASLVFASESFWVLTVMRVIYIAGIVDNLTLNISG